MLFASVKIIHLLSLLFLIASSISKNFLARNAFVTAQNIRRCRVADRVSGATAGMMIASGIGMLYLSPKGYSFYGDNILFWVKIGLLVLASALIIRTKIFFRNSANSQLDSQIKVPGLIKGILMFDLLSLFAMAGLAMLLVNGNMVRFQ